MRNLGVLLACGAVAAACSSFSSNDTTPTPTGTEDGGLDAGEGGTPISGNPADYTLTLAPVTDTVTIVQGTPTTIPITLSARGAELKGPITITVTGLPSAITAAPLTLDGTTGNLVLSGTTAAQGEADGMIEATIDTYKATTPLKVFVRGAPGALDTTWGMQGQVLAVTEAVHGQTGTADLLLGPNDDVYSVSGAIELNGGANSHVVHLDDTGVFDQAYGTGGVAAFTSFGPLASALGTDGRVVVAGGGAVASNNGSGSATNTMTYAGLPPNGGALEFSFSGQTPPGSLGGKGIGAYAVAIRPGDGHVFFGFDNVPSGLTETDCGMTHVDASGVLVSGFGLGGSERNTVSVPIGLLLQTSGNLAVVSVGTDVVDYVQYNANTGAVLSPATKTVAIAGVTRPRVGAQGLVVLADESIIAPFNGTSGLYLVKLDVNGDPVVGFGTSGVAGPYTIGGAEVATGITVDGNGKILVSLDAGGMVRFTATGDIDTNFGNAGLAPTTGTYSLHRKVVVQKKTGRILATGQGVAGGPEQVTISAYWP